jgi:hypothetical protein
MDRTQEVLKFVFGVFGVVHRPRSDLNDRRRWPGVFQFIGFGAMGDSKPHACLGFGAIDVTKPY